MHRLIIVPLVLALSLCAALGLGSGGGGEAQDGTDGTLSLDHATDDNTAAAVGTIQECADKPLSAGDEFTVDLVIQGIPGNGEDMGAFQTRITFDPSVIEFLNQVVSGPQFFLAKSGTTVSPAASENAPGDWTIGAFQLGANRGNNGDGLLSRLTFRVVGSGLTNINLNVGDDTFYTDVGVTNHGFDAVNSGAVGIGRACSVSQPTATPAQTETTATSAPPEPTTTSATATAGPAPDADADGVPTVDDKCPDTPADEDVDASGCSDAQLESLQEERTAELLEAPAAGLDLDVTLKAVTVGGSTTVLALFADENDEPVPEVEVAFTIDEQPGSDAGFEDVPGQLEVMKTSGDDGVAAAKLNVGTAPGRIVVSATAEGETESVTVTVTAVTVELVTPPGAFTGDATSDDGGGLSLWLIVAAVLVVGALLLTGLAWLARRRRRRAT